MADRKWIERVVNTRGKDCPLLRRMCLTSQCAFWIDELLKDGSGDHDVQGGCLFAWQYVMGHEQVLESVRTQAGIDKAANQIHKTALAIEMANELKRINEALDRSHVVDCPAMYGGSPCRCPIELKRGDPHEEGCPNGLLPDGEVCPRCGGQRAPSGVDGGSWVHYIPSSLPPSP